MAITSFSGEYRWLSNFYYAGVFFEGRLYPSTEHAYQAAKTLSSAEREAVKLCKTCGQAKRLGQTVTVRPDWESVKLDVMYAVVWYKFANHDNLKKLLLATGDQHLIEGNTWRDYFWGVCGGRGENHLGRILMDVRNKLWLITTET